MFKQIFIVMGLLLTALNAQAQIACKGSALCPLELSGPQPSIVSPMNCGDTQVLTYTLKNNASAPIGITDVIQTLAGDTSPHSTVNITGGSCGSSVPAKKSCTIVVTITAASCPVLSAAKFPETIARELVVDPSGNQANLTAVITVQVVTPPPPACSLELSSPQPSIQNPMDCGDEQVLVYTLQNNSSAAIGVANAIATLMGDDSASTVAITNDGCDSTVPAHTSCDIEVTIDATACSSGSFPETINRELVVDLDCSTTALTSPIGLQVIDVTPPTGNFIAAAAGHDEITAGLPTLLAVHDATGNWKNVSPNIADGVFNDVSCTGSGTSGICVAAGYIGAANITPLLYVSQDGGVTWGAADYVGTPPPAKGEFEAVSCTGSDNTAVCYAVGADNVAFLPMVFRSTNGGGSWSTVSIPISLTMGNLQAVSCIKNSASNHTCAIGGSQDENSIYMPLLGIITESGFTAATVLPAGMNAITERGVACTPTEPSGNVVCTALLTTQNDTAFALAVNNNARSSSTWSAPSITIPHVLNGTACTTLSNGQAACTAVGDNATILFTADAANLSSWNTNTVSSGNDYNVTACTSVEATAVCIAAGTGTSAPIYVNTDMLGSTTWSAAAFTALPANSDFRGTACSTQQDGKVVCIAAGSAGGAPALFVNTDILAEGAWSTPTVTPALPSTGYFLGAGGSSG